MANTKSLTVNLTIDESRNQVLYAESDKDFVDVLLSFLSIPLGTIVRLCNKNSSVLCLDSLYKSVEGLGDEYFKAIPCKDMLLRPNYAAELECLDLPVNVEGDTDRALIYYACFVLDCCHELLSSYENALCACGNKMVHKVKLLRGARDNKNHDGVFLKRATRFMITDSLMITPPSTQAVLNLLGSDATSLNTVTEKQVKVGLSEVIAILQQSLSSEDALTNVFLVTENGPSVENNTRTSVLIPASPCPGPEPGSIATDEMKEHVINPKLPAHFRLDEKFVKSDEATPLRYMCSSCVCNSTDLRLVGNAECKKCMQVTGKQMKITDPKSCTSEVINRGFVSDAMYIVTDDLVVSPPCFSTLTRMIASATEGVVEVSVNIGEKEVLALMGAALASQAVFTDVFLAKDETTTDAISAFGVVDSDYVPV